MVDAENVIKSTANLSSLMRRSGRDRVRSSKAFEGISKGSGQVCGYGEHTREH